MIRHVKENYTQILDSDRCLGWVGWWGLYPLPFKFSLIRSVGIMPTQATQTTVQW